ncbi:MAG: efflux RND transporter periplasmic adaptor subunit [Verrucomicrobiae bacterium]|nr:efflux RND transporter periplasmic adaptor subunit [Verrucomicrobiae bacterium]
MGQAVKWIVAAALVAAVAYKVKFSPVPVTEHKAHRGPIVEEVMGTGTLEPRVETTVSPKIQGRLVEVLVDQNDAVAEDQLLARLDDADLREQVAVAEAALEAAKATVERLRAEEHRAAAVLKQAQLDHQRALDLREAQVAAESDFDKAVEGMRVAEAEMSRAQAGIIEAEKQQVTAERTLRYHQARLADTELKSPLNGLVVRRDRDPGDVVVPASAVLQLIATNELWLSAWVDETAMSRLAAGQKARVVFRSEPDQSYGGEVVRLARHTDRETREFLVDVRVAQLPANWAVGQRGEVYIATRSDESAVLIPSGFVVWRDRRPGVFTNAKGRAKWRPITLGLKGMSMVEVAEGLEAGETVVRPVPGARGMLRDGQRVRGA